MENVNPTEHATIDTKESSSLTQLNPATVKKKKIFTTFLILAAVSPILYFAGSVAVYNIFPIIKLTPQKYVEVENNKPPLPAVIVQSPKTFISGDFKFSFEYPSEAYLIQQSPFSENSKTIKAIYSKNPVEPASITEENLTEGYIFKVTVLTDRRETLDEIAKAKRDYFSTSCPTTSVIQESEKDARKVITFTADACGPNFTESFIQDGKNIFEIAQIHKGDLGYNQIYKKALSQMYESFDFEDAPTETPKTVYKNEKYGFTFSHRRLNQLCCVISGPLSTNAEKLGIFAKVEGKSTNAPFDGFGVYIDLNPEKVPFNTYVAAQKKNLTDNYKLIVGREPEAIEEKVMLDNIEGIKLINYAWWAEMIYIPFPNDSKILIIVKNNLVDKNFEDEFNETTSSWKF